jgi:hypothetical protein
LIAELNTEKPSRIRGTTVGVALLATSLVLSVLVIARHYRAKQADQAFHSEPSQVVAPPSHADRSGASAQPPIAHGTGHEPAVAVSPVVALSRVAGVDPTENGWTSEAVHDQIHDQLDRLKKLLGAGTTEQDDVAPIIATDFSCGSLRPSALRAIFDSQTVKLSHADAKQDAGKRQLFAGPGGFSAALGELLGPLAASSALHAEFKAISTELRGQAVDTQLLVHIQGFLPDSAVQLNSVWRCRWSSGDGLPRLASIQADESRFEEVVARFSEGTLFSDCSESVLAGNAAYQTQLVPGISQWTARLESSIGIQLHGTQGVAVGDVNSDGLDDVYLCQPGGLPNRLLVHNRDGTVTDASIGSGADFCDDSIHALLVDLDNDGDQDLAVIVQLEVVILAGDGTGKFKLRSRHSIAGNVLALAAADYDRDGLLDIYVCVRDDDPTTKLAQGLLGTPVPYHDANNGGPNVMLRNEGGLNFSDVTASVGLDHNNTRFSQAACWEDYDNDGDLDLYVANDFGRNNLYRNDGGRFRDVAAEAGVEDISAGMSVSWGDYDNDGWADLYVGNMFSSAGNRVTYQRKFKPGTDPSTLEAFRRHARGNTLFHNLGDGTFEDVSEQAGVTMGRWAWASSFVDLNNDTWQDILVANGFVTGQDTDDL